MIAFAGLLGHDFKILIIKSDFGKSALQAQRLEFVVF